MLCSFARRAVSGAMPVAVRALGAHVEVAAARHRDAARAYLEAGRTQAAAEALARAAQHLEGLDPKVGIVLFLHARTHTPAKARPLFIRYPGGPTHATSLWADDSCDAVCGPAQASSQLYLDAVDALEEDGKESMAADLYRQAIGAHVSP